MTNETPNRADTAHLRALMADDELSAVELKRIEQLRTRQWHELARVLADHDALLCPTAARTAPPVGTGESPVTGPESDGRCHELELTHPFNLVGQCPVASAATGLAGNGLPTGAQVVGRRHDEHTVLRVCAALEAAELLNGRHPPELPPPRRP